MSAVSGGIDGLLNFYAGSDAVCDRRIETAFTEQTQWGDRLARPYFVHNDPELIDLFRDIAIPGLTLSAPGFYAPQGRVIRLPLAQTEYLERIERFEFEGMRVTNFEMESSAIAGLSALMGHRALTICAIIAQRVAGKSRPDYADSVRQMVRIAMERLSR